MAKKKAAGPQVSFDPPASLDEAAAYQRASTIALARIVSREAELKKKIQELEEEAEIELVPLRAEIFARAAAIHEFAKANRTALLRGDTKTVALPNAGEIRWYDSPGSVKLKRNVKIETVITTIKALGKNFSKFIRLVPSIDKEEMLKTPENRALASQIKGIVIAYGEFFSVYLGGGARAVRNSTGDWSIEIEKKEKQPAQAA